MTPNQFRKAALRLVDAIESAHCGHPDFRVANKVFASLNPDDTLGMVKLTPDQQREFMQSHPNMFTPCAGSWGAKGCTYVQLKSATLAVVDVALLMAWRNTAPQKLVRQFDDEP